MKNTRKKPINMRLKPELLEEISHACNLTSISNRTEFIETAVIFYLKELNKTKFSL